MTTDENNEVTIRIEINSYEYKFHVDADEWSAMSRFKKDVFLDECELEARESYCESRTWVSVTLADGTEEEI